MLTWCATHPELVTAIVGGLVTAILGPKSAEDYASMPPRLAACIKLLKAVLPDAPKIQSSIIQMVTGKFPS